MIEGQRDVAAARTVPPRVHVVMTLLAVLLSSLLLGAALRQQAVQSQSPRQWTRFKAPLELELELYDDLYTVEMLSADAGWIGGQYGRIMHWDGLEWSKDDSSVVGDVTSISAIASDDVWAVGGWHNGPDTSNGYIWHWNGTAWALVAEFSSPLFAVDAVSTSDVWAVGGFQESHSLVVHWNGEEWREVSIATPPRTAFDSLMMLSPRDGWAAAENFEYHWNGSRWSSVPDVVVWNDVGVERHVHHRTEIGGWRGNRIGLDALSIDDVWAVGAALTGGAGVAHWNGSSWSSKDLPKVFLEMHQFTSVSMVAPDDVWAVGPGIAGHWDGAEWAQQEAHHLHSVDMVSTSDGWAVGDNGVIMRYAVPGTATPTRQIAPTRPPLTAPPVSTPTTAVPPAQLNPTGTPTPPPVYLAYLAKMWPSTSTPVPTSAPVPRLGTWWARRITGGALQYFRFDVVDSHHVNGLVMQLDDPCARIDSPNNRRPIDASGSFDLSASGLHQFKGQFTSATTAFGTWGQVIGCPDFSGTWEAAP